MRKKKRYKLVGEGDDFIEYWYAPISDYKVLLKAYKISEDAEIDFPIRELISCINKNGYSLRKDKSYSISSTEDILEAILKPYFSIDGDHWGGDSPGLSGYYVKAYLELGNTKLIREILVKAEEFLLNWENRLASKRPQEAPTLVTELSERMIPFLQADIKEAKSREWEDKLYDQVKAAVDNNIKLIRFNYLVYQGTIFNLNRSWWHTVIGSIENVTSRFRSAGYEVVDCEVVTTKRGWISYYARTNEEESDLGWNEKTIEVFCPHEWSKKLEEARK